MQKNTRTHTSLFDHLLTCFIILQMITPANTPATPPNFPETLLAFSKLSAGSASDSTRLTSSPASNWGSNGYSTSDESTDPTSVVGSATASLKQGLSQSPFCSKSHPNPFPLTSPSNH